MAQKIERLTAEEEALIPRVRDEWLRTGLATGAGDRNIAQAAISDAYSMAGLEPPRIWVWLGSPWAGCVGAWMLTKLPAAKNSVGAQVRDQVWDQVWDQVGEQVGDQVWDQVGGQVWGQVGEQVGEQVGAQVWKAGYGQHDAGWLSFFDAFRRMKRVNGPERLEPLMRLATVAGWWWPFEGACIITERPIALHRDEAWRLHSDNGPALAYSDGWAIHAWHGLRIPAWMIRDKARITPDTIDAEPNAELRRVMLEIFGFDKYIEARGAKLIAQDEALGLPRHLFEISLAGEPVRVLRVVNGTIEPDGEQRRYHLGVPLTVNSPHAAVAWSYGRPAERYREAVRS